MLRVTNLSLAFDDAGDPRIVANVELDAADLELFLAADYASSGEGTGALVTECDVAQDAIDALVAAANASGTDTSGNADGNAP